MSLSSRSAFAMAYRARDGKRTPGSTTLADVIQAANIRTYLSLPTDPKPVSPFARKLKRPRCRGRGPLPLLGDGSATSLELWHMVHAVSEVQIDPCVRRGRRDIARPQAPHFTCWPGLLEHTTQLRGSSDKGVGGGLPHAQRQQPTAAIWWRLTQFYDKAGPRLGLTVLATPRRHFLDRKHCDTTIGEKPHAYRSRRTV
ncbi:hypothetical protein PYCCODRAFT_1200778 [Trametes coccinea BRFM310]|uniref:Uncharacterized protein n=1 Tax=Trametes coccinea (strain BRFM310) TaxID=1353009 RepID=A0A1Y2I9H2_TRAC3|nr:hypothetical protein PYCCODRAFT_1200778 [Trametes coccinea BRFM310]